MSHHQVPDFAAQVSQLGRGQVIDIQDDGSVVVTSNDLELAGCLCDTLTGTGGDTLQLAVDDEVLLWVPPSPDARGVILGRIGPTQAAAVASSGSNEATPDTLVLEAKHSLTLRVGEGSITIREDGKILIKGKDLVSHAQRTNRIKGGSVSIN